MKGKYRYLLGKNGKLKLLLLSHKDLVQLTYKLWEKIQIVHRQNPFDLIIEINRGGMVGGRYLSDFMGRLPVVSITLQSYRDIAQRKAVQELQGLNVKIKGKKVLIVDELTDGGPTFKKALEIVNGRKPREVKTAAWFKKPNSSFTPDFFVDEVDEWIVFPYEVRETMKCLSNQLVTDKKLRQGLWKYYHYLGLSLRQIGVLWQANNSLSITNK